MAAHLRIWLLSFLIVSYLLWAVFNWKFHSQCVFLKPLWWRLLKPSCWWGNLRVSQSIPAKKIIVFSLQIISYICPIQCSNVVQLTEETFDKFVGKNRWSSSANTCIIDAGLSQLLFINGRQLQSSGFFTRISPTFLYFVLTCC